MRLRLLSAKDIEQALSMKEAIEVNGHAYEILSSGEAQVPQRMSIDMPKGVTLIMPAYLHDTGALAVKVVSVFKKNLERGIPTVHAMVMVVNSETGVLRALMDGTRLTSLRTGAASGVATQLLASENAHVLAMFGAGGQAPEQIRAITTVRPIEDIRICTPSGRSARSLADRLKKEYPDMKIQAVDSPSKAAEGAEVINCATTSSMPVFDPADVLPGTHINGIGSFTPEMREVQVVGLPQLRIFVDSSKAALAEAGDLIQAIDEGHLLAEDLTEIGKVVSGAAFGRNSAEEITFFKSVGVAVQDAATAHAVLLKAEEMDIGVLIDL